MDRSFLKDSIKNNDPITPLTYEFNFLPAMYIHESRIGQILSKNLFAKIKGSRRAITRISLVILRHFQLIGDYFFDFRESSHRLALVDTPALNELVLLTGSALYSDIISRTIERSSVLKIKASIGEDVYRFAIKRAPFLFKKEEIPIDVPPLGDDVKKQIIATGLSCLDCCLENAPGAIKKRVYLKFSEKWYDSPRVHFNSSIKDNIYQLMRKILQEANPQWTTLFS